MKLDSALKEILKSKDQDWFLTNPRFNVRIEAEAIHDDKWVCSKIVDDPEMAAAIKKLAARLAKRGKR